MFLFFSTKGLIVDTKAPVVPGAFTAIGTGIGAIGGTMLSSKIEPKLLDYGLQIAGVDKDDLFYYQNKPAINQVGIRLQEQVKLTKQLLSA